MKARSRVTNSQLIWMTPQGDASAVRNPVRNSELHGEMMIVPPQTGGSFSPSSEGSDAGGGGRHGLAD